MLQVINALHANGRRGNVSADFNPLTLTAVNLMLSFLSRVYAAELENSSGKKREEADDVFRCPGFVRTFLRSVRFNVLARKNQ